MAFVIALGNVLIKRDDLIRFVLLLAVLILSLLIVPFAFTHAVSISSNSTASILPTLMLYDLSFPFGSMAYILLQYVLARVWGTHLAWKASFSAVLLSVLLGFGGFANNVSWI